MGVYGGKEGQARPPRRSNKTPAKKKDVREAPVGKKEVVGKTPKPNK